MRCLLCVKSANVNMQNLLTRKITFSFHAAYICMGLTFGTKNKRQSQVENDVNINRPPLNPNSAQLSRMSDSSVTKLVSLTSLLHTRSPAMPQSILGKGIEL